MQRGKKSRIIEQIEQVEEQLRLLRLELETEDEPDDNQPRQTGPLVVGETVIIRNPKGYQGNKGVLTKIHQRSKRGTVTTRNRLGNEENIVRLLSNLRRPEQHER